MFLTDENKQMLWDIITDEDIFKNLSKDVDVVQYIEETFHGNIKGFYDIEKGKSNNLLDLNKKYIVLILNYVKDIYNLNKTKQPTTSNQTPNKDKSYTPVDKSYTPVDKSYTHNDIQNDKRARFENELNTKQQEFTRAMTLPAPPIPKFSDNLDEPISEMADAIKKITEQRKYDIDQIYNKPEIDKKQPQQENPTLKYIKIDKETVVDLNVIDLNTKKHISWATNIAGDEDGNIFTKLKTVKVENKTDTLQHEVNELKKQMEIMNANIQQILGHLNDMSPIAL
jgi:DNA-binding XRE family transcriptional regulator